MNKIPVAIIDKEELNIKKIEKLLDNISDLNIIHRSRSVNDLEILLQESSPILVFVGPAIQLEDIGEILQTYSSALNTVKVILLAKDTSAELLRKAIKLNIHDVLEFPFTYDELKESIKRAENLFASASLARNSQEAKTKDFTKEGHKKIMVYSPKGGSGKSFIATNLAIALHNQTKKDVTVFDINYQFGDIALLLNLYPRHTVYDVVSAMDSLDKEMLNSFLTPHESGIKILPAPIDPSQDESISTGDTLKILKMLAEVSPYLVIDAPSMFSDTILSVIDETDYLCLVASMDVPSIKNLKISLQVLDKLKFPRGKIFIVLNRAGSKVGITLDEIEKTIGRKIDVAVPSHRIVPVTVNKGIPVVIDSPRSAVSKSINRLAKLLLTSKLEQRELIFS
ncbi:MAG: P-loop NTPase [Actinomycetia bacterium]|nr:P-loop NTPase [Actinomycetes bacterium]